MIKNFKNPKPYILNLTCNPNYLQFHGLCQSTKLWVAGVAAKPFIP